jgi:uncharacterized protein
LIWNELITPCVRDLAWSCFSEPILISAELDSDTANSDLLLTPGRRQWLRNLDQQPLALEQHLSALKSTRLGLYFESLWHFFIEQDPDLEMIAHNLPVREAGATLGEFDLIYANNQSGESIHLELAVKFYLGVSATNIWLGPSQRDELDLKVAHLFKRQSRLGLRPQGQAELAKLGVSHIQRRVEMKGYLFQNMQTQAGLPSGFNANNNARKWYPQSLFNQYAVGGSWWQLDRQQWFAPITEADVYQPWENRLLETRRPALVARLNEQGKEVERCFVAADDWAAHADQLVSTT